MIDERRGEQAAARRPSVAPVALPAKSWRDVKARAATLDARAELSDDGSQVRITVECRRLAETVALGDRSGRPESGTGVGRGRASSSTAIMLGLSPC